MSPEEKILGYLGIAARGRNLESGEYAVLNAVRDGRACLLIVASDASANTRGRYENLCASRGIPMRYFVSGDTLGARIGKGFRAVIAVTDTRLSQTILGQFALYAEKDGDKGGPDCGATV